LGKTVRKVLNCGVLVLAQLQQLGEGRGKVFSEQCSQSLGSEEKEKENWGANPHSFREWS